MDGIVVGIGEVLWDILPDGRMLGGAPANFDCHVLQMGLSGCVVSAVGDDNLGDEIIERLRNQGMNKIIMRVPYPTGTVQVSVDSEGVPQYEITEGVAWDNIPFTPKLETLARNTRAVCFGSLAQRNEVSRQTITRFIEAVPENAYRILDINLRQKFYTREILCESLRRCNVLKLNDEELDVLVGMFALDGSPEQSCRALMSAYGLEIIVLTCGTDGSYVFTPGESSFIETPVVDVVDTVGAGDAFTAAFVSAMLRGRSVPEAHRIAVDVSAYVCTRAGAMPELLPAFKID